MFKKFITLSIMMLIAIPSISMAGVTLGAAHGTTPGLWAYKWSWETGGAETTASDSTKLHKINGKVVGVLAVETTIDTAYTIKILDSAGRDVLQGIFTDTEASATATDDALYRVPVDSTSGGYIWLFNEPVYLDISSAGNSNSGDVYILVQQY